VILEMTMRWMRATSQSHGYGLPSFITLALEAPRLCTSLSHAILLY
jgi:hypothetical protein